MRAATMPAMLENLSAYNVISEFGDLAHYITQPSPTSFHLCESNVDDSVIGIRHG